GMPMFGSCAGMIMLADRVTDAREDQQFIGGIDMTVRRNAFGRQVDSFEIDLEVQGVDGGPLRAVFIRAPWVEQASEEVQILATLRTGEQAGTIVAVQQGPLLATSFHPELTGDHRIHGTFVEIVRQYA
ncbi:MAG: pyridoxal 5'-phosphate synthase glutaminase subunit PdxT, partial [Actinomycetota bacterium]|nr:pyridoxal 5'-phosphate synthase glutaminase subunit PdxT [Actinomycetota bacterium]